MGRAEGRCCLGTAPVLPEGKCTGTGLLAFVLGSLKPLSALLRVTVPSSRGCQACLQVVFPVEPHTELSWTTQASVATV